MRPGAQGVYVGVAWWGKRQAQQGVPVRAGSAWLFSIAMVMGLVAGCHHGGEGVKDVSTSGSATGARASQSPDGLPLWEQPELLAKYPVRAKKNPDGSYDYSDPKFENADLCKDLPPHYWEKRGYMVDNSVNSKLAGLKDCWLDDGSENFSTAIAIATDKKKRKDVVGRLFKQYRPGRFDQIGNNFGFPTCIAYMESSIGRVGFSYTDMSQQASEGQLCHKARENLEKVS